MRHRDERYVAALREAIIESETGEVGSKEKLHAAMLSDQNIGQAKDPKRRMQLALTKFEQKIRRPDVRAALRDVYADLVGFTPQEAAMLHVKHIRGKLYKEQAVNVKDRFGNTTVEVRKVRIPPSFAALRAYQQMTFPEPPREVHTRSEHLHATVKMNLGEPIETMQRAIGEMATNDPRTGYDETTVIDDEGDEENEEDEE